jgi:alpha-1,3-rhamnosyl/mannosyltransferase
MARLARRRGAGGGALGDTRLVLAGFPGWRQGGRIPTEDRDALGERLVEVGTVPDATLWALYRGAALFAFPSRHEGFGLPVLEAMGQGTAVLCSDIPALREVAGTAAAFAPVGDVAGWAERIQALLADDAERARLGAAGRARAAEFPVRAFVEGTHRAYLDVLGT